MADGKEYAPIENNHQTLLFDVSHLPAARAASLTYLPERAIQNDLKITDAINVSTLVGAVMALLFLPRATPFTRRPLERRVPAQLVRPPLGIQGVVAVFIVSLWLFAPALYAFLGTAFLIWALYGLDIRIVGGAVGLLFIAIALLLAFGEAGLAEQYAVYAFGLLCVAIALQAIDLFWPRRAPV